MAKNKGTIKGLLAGLGLGAIVAGATVFFLDPKNRKKVKQKTDELDVQTTLKEVQEKFKQAGYKGKEKLIAQLEKTKKQLEGINAKKERKTS